MAIVDTPSDRCTLDDFRHTAEHAQDIATVIAFLGEQSRSPVWAIGTSHGSLSTATASALSQERGPDGLVLNSSTTRKPLAEAHRVPAAALDRITVPTLFVHHRDDQCVVTTWSFPDVMASMPNAKKIDLIAVDCGFTGTNACHGGYHQFLGIENGVTQKAVNWIEQY